jgi:hypothetical protein
MSDDYRTHGALSEPGRFKDALAALPSDLPALCGFIQGVVLHADWATEYGVNDTTLSRQTLPVAERMAMVEATGTRSLPPERRTPGTCRDFALMLCSLLRERGVAARVRCGFANYFTANPFEDHWVCEYRLETENRWALADAQLDALMREKLGIVFDPTDLPAGAFLNAGEAWTAWRESRVDADAFGHGPVKGAWFLRVNLVRDLLALNRQETSAWDAWRTIPPESRPLDAEALAAGDAIAAVTRCVGSYPPADVEIPPIRSMERDRRSGEGR